MNPEEPSVEATCLNLDIEEPPESVVHDTAHQSENNTESSLKDKRVWTLSFVSCCFEGTIFLLMYFWPGALHEAHVRGEDTQSGGAKGESDNDSGVNNEKAESEAYSVPYGVTFACFMATMVLGALLFNALVQRHHYLISCQYEEMVTDTALGGTPPYSNMILEDTTGHKINPRSTRFGDYHVLAENALSALTRALTPTRLLSMALLLAGASFLAAAFVRAELPLFVAFLVLEFCNGVYVPSMALHRSAVVGDAGRASVYAVMNVPLFVFVVVALCTSTTSGHGGENSFFFLFLKKSLSHYKHLIPF